MPETIEHQKYITPAIKKSEPQIPRLTLRSFLESFLTGNEAHLPPFLIHPESLDAPR